MIDTSKIYTSKNHGNFKIVEYISSRNIEIEFIFTGFKMRTKSYCIDTGGVKDLLSPSVYGVGFIGVGNKKPMHNKESYQTWRSMLSRCYNPHYQKANNSYKGVSVCDEWHNFQNFTKWFDENYIKGHQLDKDIRVIGNRVYSAAACSFVSGKTNTIKAHAKTYELLNPKGSPVKVFNMAQFCRDKSLNSGAMIQVAKGNTSHHKGWTKA